jgi:hypothetical protein
MDQPAPDTARPPRRSNADYRWTVPKVTDFLEALSRTGKVAEAARSVGMSRQAAYRLRARLDGAKFRAAFEGARKTGLKARAAASIERHRSRWDGPGIAALDHLRQDDASPAQGDRAAPQGDTRRPQGDAPTRQDDAFARKASEIRQDCVTSGPRRAFSRRAGRPAMPPDAAPAPGAPAKPIYRVPMVERTGMRRLEEGRGHSKLLMPLEGNANHVDVMYLGAFCILAEAAAAGPGISVLDTARFFPIVKDIAVDFHRMAASDVTGEFTLTEEQIEGLLADLERKGSAGYLAEVSMRDAEGTLVATGRVTIKLLSHGWKGEGVGAARSSP